MRPVVVAVGPLPPPVHGAAAITEAVCAAVRESVELVPVNTSPGDRRGTSYHLYRLWRHAAAGRMLVRHRRRHPRTMYAACPGGQAIWYLVALAFLARILGYRIVVHHHSFAYLTTTSTAMRLLVLTGGAACVHVLLCDEMLSRFATRYGGRARLLACSNAVWMPPTADGPSPPAPKPFTIGHLGRLTNEKGLPDVLATLRGLLDSDVDAVLVLAGPISDEDSAHLAASSSDLGERLVLLGPVSGSAKEEFFSSIDAFVFPSRYVHEAEPLVVLEALSAGVGVVAYGRGCIPGMVRGESGRVVHPEQEFSTGAVPYLCALATSETERKRVRRAARDAFALTVAESSDGRRKVLAALAAVQEPVGE